MMILTCTIIGILAFIQILIAIVSLKKGKKQYRLQFYTNAGVLCLLLILWILHLISLDLRILPLGIACLIFMIWNYCNARQQKIREIKHRGRYVFGRIFCCLFYILLTLPFFIFPYYQKIPPSGNLSFETKTITWKNDATNQLFVKTKKGSKVITAQFWYPKETSSNEKQKYPLVVFCHGFSMLRDSNLSLFEELASNGYVVCSVDLDYETLWSVRENHSIALQKLDELTDLSKAKTDKESLETCIKWNHIRANDLNNTIAYITKRAGTKSDVTVFNEIDTDDIAMAGHSFGGSAAVEVAQKNPNVKAVVDMDGTAYSLFQTISKKVITSDETPYTTPILMMFSEPHVKLLKKYKKIYSDTYPNVVLLKHAKLGYSAKIKGADHFSFSDMHINAPIAAFVSGGSQTRDSKDAIKTINGSIEKFLDKYLKNAPYTIPADATY